jgi:hypothetical protein
MYPTPFVIGLLISCTIVWAAANYIEWSVERDCEKTFTVKRRKAARNVILTPIWPIVLLITALSSLSTVYKDAWSKVPDETS